MTKIPERLLKSEYRKEMWRNTERIIKILKKVLPVSDIHVLGSFTTNKKRPADVDLIVFLNTKYKNKENWCVDLVLAPDNKFGKYVLEDTKKWMKQKYGSKNSEVIKLK